MIQRFAVETLTLKEVSEIFKKSLEIAMPRAKGAIDVMMKKLERAKVSNHKWVKSYEIFKPAKINFYCQKIPKLTSPIVSIGMTHRTAKGLILVVVDTSNGGALADLFGKPHWNGWVKIFTSHCCERFAERIMKIEKPTFQQASEEVMFADLLGPVRIKDTLADGIDEIEFQFKEGQAYGYRDSKSKIIYFRTIYSNDMLKGDRQNFRQEWETPLNELYGLFKLE